MKNRRSAKLSRRQLLKGGALAGAGLLVPWNLNLSKAAARTNGAAATTAQPPEPDPRQSFLPDAEFYTAPLPAAIPVATPKYRVGTVASVYEIAMKQGRYRFHPKLSKTTPTWGYDDLRGGYLGYLGPTLEVRRYEGVEVKWINNLPNEPGAPFGLVDPNLVPGNLPDARAVVHVHGGHNPSRFDGGPENWFVPGQSAVYTYANNQDAASIWYHDHAVGTTRLNVYAGLAGLYLIRESQEDRLNLPRGKYEIPLVIQDKAFWDDGTNLNLWYPSPWAPESFGNSILVNTQLWPVLEVEPRRYRFRIYNAANARFFRLRLSNTPGGTVSVLPFHQIGAEGGLLPRSAQLDALLVGNGERADVIIDFKGKEGQSIYLTNDAATPFEPGQPPLDPSTDFDVMQIMKFKVKSAPVADTSLAMPSVLKQIRKLDPQQAAVSRNITLVEAPYMPNGVDTGFMKVLVNARDFMVGDGEITETPKLGTTEVWNYMNLTPDTHPMHMHLVMFQVVNRQRFNAEMYLADHPAGNGRPYEGWADPSTGPIDPKYLIDPVTNAPYPILPPEPNETGFKDTVRANPGEITRVIAKFEHYTGKFVFHCHILDHEENDMMQYMEVQAGMSKESADNDPALEGTQPDQYVLEQNYPNPFNPETQIRFQVPEDGPAVLRIFNTTGQEVATPINGYLPAGSHVVNWNAKNLASGVYYYRLEAGGAAITKKMMMLR